MRAMSLSSGVATSVHFALSFQACRTTAFPADPSKAVHDENEAAHVERIYCSHTYHHDCLILYMKTPPFQSKQASAISAKGTQLEALLHFPDGKKCHACSQRIYHEKWKVTPELAEARWAHEQAKNRELGEAIEFMGDLAVMDS